VNAATRRGGGLQRVADVVRRLLQLPPFQAIVAMAMFVMAVVACIVIIGLHQRVDHVRAAQIQFETLRATLHRVEAAEWAAIAHRSPTQAPLSDLKQLRQRAARLVDLAATSSDAPTVRTEFHAYASALDAEIAALEAGEYDRAVGIDATTVDPAFERLRVVMDVISSERRRDAEGANRRAEVSTIVALSGAALLVPGFFVALVLARTRRIAWSW
jgi:hypothetical protein